MVSKFGHYLYPLTLWISWLIECCWKIIFRENPIPETVNKVSQFLIFGAGMITARIFSIAVQIIMGRKLGPEIYGQITMIMLLANYFSMPIISGWGLVFTKIAAQKTERNVRLQALKSLLIVVFFSCILTILTLTTLRNLLASWLNIDNQIMLLTIVMTVLYAWWMLSKQISQGFQNWHMYVTIENTWSLVVFSGIICTILVSKINLYTVTITLYLGYFFAGLIICKAIWQSFSVKVNILFTQDILLHGWILLLNGLVGVATFTIDRILINKTLGTEEVGIYQAHYLATYGTVSAFITILLTYAFPLFCREKKNDIYSAIGKINKIQYPITILFSIVVGSAIIWLYSYPVSLTLFASLCIFNGVQFHLQLKTWYIASKGASASKIALKSQIILATNVIILLILIRYVGIIAGGISLLVAACVSLAYLIISEKEILDEKTV